MHRCIAGHNLKLMENTSRVIFINPLATGPEYISFFFIFYQPIKYRLFNMLKIKRDINQQDCKIFDLNYVKSK